MPALREELREAFRHVINSASRENASDTPDFVLAEYLTKALEAFELATSERDQWYRRGYEPLPAPGRGIPSGPREAARWCRAEFERNFCCLPVGHEGMHAAPLVDGDVRWSDDPTVAQQVHASPPLVPPVVRELPVAAHYEPVVAREVACFVYCITQSREGGFGAPAVDPRGVWEIDSMNTAPLPAGGGNPPHVQIHLLWRLVKRVP